MTDGKEKTLERPAVLYSGPIHREPCHSSEPCFPVTSFNSVKLLVHIKGLLIHSEGTAHIEAFFDLANYVAFLYMVCTDLFTDI